MPDPEDHPIDDVAPILASAVAPFRTLAADDRDWMGAQLRAAVAPTGPLYGARRAADARSVDRSGERRLPGVSDSASSSEETA